MKTSEEILAYYLSEESADIFGAQRVALLCLLPFEMAKPYLSEGYVKAHDEGTLEPDEAWEGDHYDVKANIKAFIPEVYKAFEDRMDAATIAEGLLHLKALIWVIDEPFHDELMEFFVGDPLEEGKLALDRIAKHFGYEPTIQDIEFEEVPVGETSKKTSPDEDA